MKKILSLALIVVMALATLFAIFPATAPAYAEAGKGFNLDDACANADADEKAALGCQNKDKFLPDVVVNLLNVVITIAGILAVFLIVFAGQRYMVSQGDPAKLSAAKGMLMYSIIGMLIIILAFAIVNFVLAGIGA